MNKICKSLKVNSNQNSFILKKFVFTKQVYYSNIKTLQLELSTNYFKSQMLNALKIVNAIKILTN